MSYETLFKLKTNPFRLTPATNPQEIIWAGFPDIKKKFESRIQKAVKIPNSSLVLNWGEYGSGKTHAARFFSKKDTLEKISDGISTTLPYSMVFSLPKGKEPIYNLFSLVVDKLDIALIRKLAISSGLDFNGVIDNYTDNIHYRSVLKAIFSDVDENMLKKYLYGNILSKELKDLDKYQILRTLNTEGDYTKILAGLFTCLTFERKVFSTVIIWIDEFEDITTLSNSSIDKVNNFIREVLDNTPNNLLIFINLTQSSLFGEEDLSQYLFDSVKSRIKERIILDLPSQADILIYVKDILKFYRSFPVSDDLFPFEQASIDFVVSTLGNVSLRRFNEAFSILLELGDMEGKSPITKDFVEKHIDEIAGWKES